MRFNFFLKQAPPSGEKGYKMQHTCSVAEKNTFKIGPPRFYFVALLGMVVTSTELGIGLHLCLSIIDFL